MSDEDWDKVIAVHLRGAFLCARAAQKPMVAQKSGRIISVSSTSALGNRGQVNYSAAKAGLQGLTRTLSIELGPFGITANAVAPGFIATEMTEAMPEPVLAGMIAHTPLGRLGTPDDVAHAYLFLASEEAGFINGAVLTVDGGLVVGT
jgi:3-oxoacyl-[acyl-carrier protein] reductase